MPGLEPAASPSPSWSRPLLMAFLALFAVYCPTSSFFSLFLVLGYVPYGWLSYPLTCPLSEVGGGLGGGSCPPRLCPMPALGWGLFVCCWGFVSPCVRVRVSMCLRTSVYTLWSWGQDLSLATPEPLFYPLYIRGGCLVRG